MTVLALAGKELQLYFTSFLFYALASVFLALSAFYFSTNLSFFVVMGGMQLQRGLWQYQFLDMQQRLLVLLPLLTMRLFAEERKLGTLELLWTYPVRDVEIIAGKFIACLAVVTLMLAGTAVYPLMLVRFYPVAAGPLVAGYLGLWMLAAAFVACGLFVSALTENQLLAGAATYGVLLFFWVVTWNEAAMNEVTRHLLLPFSLFDRFYMTPGRELSLSPVTQQLLAQVKEPLRITVFFQRGTREQYAQLLERLRVLNRRVESELYDLDRYPDRARSLGITLYGRAAIEYAGRRTVAPALPEEELAGGIMRALRGRSRRIVFKTGHGERAPGGGPESYGRLAGALGAENYVPESHSLLDGPVPPETDLVLVTGPKHDFLLPELDELARYLKGGGGVLLLLDPAPLPNLARFLASMGIRLGDDFVVDRDKRVLGTDGLAAVVELFKRGNPVSDPSSHPIESGVVLPSARRVDVAAEVPGVDG